MASGDFSQRLHWMLFGRRSLARKLPGFWASVWSYADRACAFAPGVKIYRDARLVNVTLGRMSYVAESARLGYCKVASFSSIGPKTLIGGLGKHPTQFVSTHPAFYSTHCQAGRSYALEDVIDELPVTLLGNDVWIGAGAIILDGCSIGDGSIVAAGAVVIRDASPCIIVAGSADSFRR